jgi:hypothetical protein
LTYGDALLSDPALPQAIRQPLQEAPGAFLLGNTAGDVQYVMGEKRIATHLYHVPPPGPLAPAEKLLHTYPTLADPQRLPLAQAAFISGYLLHLTWDAVWAIELFCPLYKNAAGWPDRRSWAVHHNALRLVLDRRAEATLHQTLRVPAALREAHPDHWLPFAPDDALCTWRDWLVEQLSAPETVQTATVFARRMHVTTEHLEAVADAIECDAPDAHVPGLTEALTRFERLAHRHSLALLREYWSGAHVPGDDVATAVPISTSSR